MGLGDGCGCEQYPSVQEGLAHPQNANSNAVNISSFWSWHDGDAHFLLMDGSVHLLSLNTSKTILEVLSTRGGEELPGEFHVAL
jgi:hypothetical protein